MARRICVVLGSRANYSSIKSAMRAITKDTRLVLHTVVSASALLDRYGSVIDLVKSDGFGIDERVHSLIEGETPATMAQSTGVGLMILPSVFERLQPDVVLTVGDRFETMATTLAAAYMNIRVAHTMGGEVTGTIDESIRHAVTKFAHIHFPASADAAERIVKLGEDPRHVHLVGCPRVDLVAEVLRADANLEECHIFRTGVGHAFDLNKPFLLVSQHPVTSEYGRGEQQICETLMALERVGMPVVMLWPNADAGSEDVARGIRKWREHGKDRNMHFFKNLPVSTYIKLMRATACLVGNSSSGIREGAFIGTPVVNVGTRQDGRMRGRNVTDVECDATSIADAIDQQVRHGPFDSEPIYGDGKAGERIAGILAEKALPATQKTITY